MLQQRMKFQHFEQKDNRPADCFWFVGNTDLSTANFRIVGDTTSFRDSLRTEGSSECHDLKSSPIRPRLAIQNWRAVIRRWESLWAGSFRCPPMRQYSRWSSPLGTVHKRTSHLLCGQRMVTLFRRREAFKSTTTQQNWGQKISKSRSWVSVIRYTRSSSRDVTQNMLPDSGKSSFLLVGNTEVSPAFTRLPIRRRA
jgi:hypothetical protein